VTVEMVPWCDGKNQLTTTYRWYLATWAKRLSWSEVGSIFRTSWDSVCRAVEFAVEWGLAHRELSGLTALGVDEIAWAKGHTYLTLLYDISGPTKRLLAVAEERKEASLRSCLESLGDPVCLGVKYVCSDMWKPYLNVIAEKLGQAVHVLDRCRRSRPNVGLHGLCSVDGQSGGLSFGDGREKRRSLLAIELGLVATS
jgi:transposase